MSVHRADLCADHFNTSSFKAQCNTNLKIYLKEKTAMKVGETQKTNGEQNKKKEMTEIENTYNNAIVGTSFDID